MAAAQCNRIVATIRFSGLKPFAYLSAGRAFRREIGQSGQQESDVECERGFFAQGCWTQRVARAGIDSPSRNQWTM